MSSIDMKYLIFFVISHIVAFIFLINSNIDINIIHITFLINFSLIFIFILFSSQNTVKTILFFYFFNIVFFIIAPWVQYNNNTLFWTHFNFNDNNYLLNNFIIFFSLIVVFISYSMSPVFLYSKLKIKEGGGNKFIAILMGLICFFIVLYSYGFNFSKLFFRGFVEDEFEYNVKVSQYFRVISVTAMILPVFIFLRFLKNGTILFKMILFLLVLLCAFPTAIPRFMVAYIYFPLLIALIPKAKYSSYMMIFLILSIFYIFPFLNQFRYFENLSSISFVPDLGFLNEAHFDAYQNLMDVIRFEFITYGYQLLGALLFFIPRLFWADKPYGSGYHLAETKNYFFNNISMPYVAEGYVNFGLFGIVLFCIIIGFIMKQIDFILLSKENMLYDKYQIYLGVFLCAALFFMFRGDLMSSYGNLLAGIIAYYLAKKI